MLHLFGNRTPLFVGVFRAFHLIKELGKKRVKEGKRKTESLTINTLKKYSTDQSVVKRIRAY